MQTILLFYVCQISDSIFDVCGFRLVSSTRHNVVSRGLPVFESFCKLLRNVVTETFVEPSENFGSLGQIEFGQVDHPVPL